MTDDRSPQISDSQAVYQGLGPIEQLVAAAFADAYTHAQSQERLTKGLSRAQFRFGGKLVVYASCRAANDAAVKAGGTGLNLTAAD